MKCKYPEKVVAIASNLTWLEVRVLARTMEHVLYDLSNFDGKPDVARDEFILDLYHKASKSESESNSKLDNLARITKKAESVRDAWALINV